MACNNVLGTLGFYSVIFFQIVPLMVWNRVLDNLNGHWSPNVHYVNALQPDTAINTLVIGQIGFITHFRKGEHTP